jgi:predicted ABC-type ATPase
VRDPVLLVVAGPNGAGKTTFYERVIEPVTHLPFVNADRIAAERWPGASAEAAYRAAGIAAEERARRLGARESFVTETVFSHPSKLDLLRKAVEAGFRVHLHVVTVPVDLAVARVRNRVAEGGHPVPEDKIRARYHRLFDLLAVAVGQAHEARVYDNSRAATPFVPVAAYADGRPVGEPVWPPWIPDPLRLAGG